MPRGMESPGFSRGEEVNNNWALDKNYVPQCYEKPVTIEAR